MFVLRLLAYGILIQFLSSYRCWAIVCYHCDSIANEQCAMTLGEVGVLPFVECGSELTCAMSIVDSITYRGCGSDTPLTGASYKKSCSSNLCNSGVYPPGRLKCHHCAGESCVTQPQGKPRPCVYHREQDEDQCYTEVENAKSVYRGCVSDTNHTIASNAQYCKINGCNNEYAVNRLICARCDSSEDRGCKMDLFQVNSGLCNITLLQQCEMDVLLTEDKSCFTYHRLNHVIRGCSTQLPSNVTMYPEHVTTCTSENNCNIRCIQQPKCLSCNSANNELCRSNATGLVSSVCGSSEASSCYACEYDDWSISRGCGKPPNVPGVARCYECDSESCNNLSFTRCYQCSTEEAGPGCATWERPNGNIYIEECQTPEAKCVVARFNNETTIRGCERTDFNCNSGNMQSCESCEGNFCNKGPFPDRIWCHQCSGGNKCEMITQDPIPCPIFDNESAYIDHAYACLEYYDTYNHKVVRGCRSNALLYYECMLKSYDGCKLCNTNGCNANIMTSNNNNNLNISRPPLSITFRNSAGLLSSDIIVIFYWFFFHLYYLLCRLKI